MKNMLKSVAIMGILASSVLSQVNIKSSSINFRDYYTPYSTTYHYGDLRISGGQAGTGWGWLYTNRLYNYGNSLIFGNLDVYGSKNFVHPHPQDTSKVIKYIAVESGEALTLMRGTAATYNGQAIIEMPEHFRLVTSDDVPVTVLITPEKAPVMLFTQKKSKDEVVINMKNSDFNEYGDVEFAFQVTGVRDGFESEDIVVEIGQAEVKKAVSKNRESYNKRLDRLINNIKNKDKQK